MNKIILFLVVLLGSAAVAADLGVPRFSQLRSLQGSAWEPLVFRNIKRHSRYRLVQEGGATVVRAETADSASGLIARRRIDTETAPVIQWRWRVSNVYEKGDAGSRDGDDYPARVYVAFAFEPERASLLEKAKRAAIKVFYGEDLPGSALNYIWANKLEPGTIVPNAYSDKTRMLAVDSGPAKTGRWVSHRRNIIEDYREAFGHAPPAIIGIGIMSDSDNTGESATAWYGDIRLRPAD